MAMDTDLALNLLTERNPGDIMTSNTKEYLKSPKKGDVHYDRNKTTYIKTLW